MNDLRNRISRLLQAIKSPQGLEAVEACVQEVLRKQYGTGTPATLQPTAATVAAIPQKTTGQMTELVFDDPNELLPWEKAFNLCCDILYSLDDLPERAEDFADSVREKVESMQAWIEKEEDVTAAQLEALRNMEYGVSRWQR